MPEHDKPGIIPFDAGLLMTTETEFMFREHLKLHPGAISAYANFLQDPVECGHSRCAMGVFQEQMRLLFGRDTEKATEFFNRLLKFEGMNPGNEAVQSILGEVLGKPIALGDHPDIDSDIDLLAPELQDMIRNVFPGARVTVIRSPEDWDKLNDDK